MASNPGPCHVGLFALFFSFFFCFCFVSVIVLAGPWDIIIIKQIHTCTSFMLFQGPCFNGGFFIFIFIFIVTIHQSSRQGRTRVKGGIGLCKGKGKNIIPSVEAFGILCAW